MSETYSITITDQPDPADAAAIDAGLAAFNLQYAPPYNSQRLLVVLRDADNRAVGGAVGNTWWGWLRANTPAKF